MKCDELKRFDIVGKYTDDETIGECYDADEVDAAIAELKAKLDEYVLVKLSTQQMLQNLLDCGLIKEWYFNGKFNFVLKADDPHLQIKELNAKLKESEDARYEAGADAADYYQEKLKMERALWLMTAEWAESMGIASCNIAIKLSYKEHFFYHDEANREKDIKKYRHRQVVFYKYADYCRAKAEEYK